MDNLEPITRNEMFLNGDDLEPITREEMILAGADLEPITRHEWFLKRYRGGGGGGGYDLVNVPNLPADIASFNDGTDLPMASLKVTVTPYQDLHGYDGPWVGGSGKNKAVINDDTLAKPSWYGSGVWSGTTKVSEGQIQVTRSDKQGGMGGIVINNVTPNTEYTLSFNAEVDGTIYYGYTTDGTTIKTQNTMGSYPAGDKSFNITIPSNTVGFYIKFAATSVPSKISKIQFEVGSQATTYMPAENICPISGWDEAVVTVADDAESPTTSHEYTIDLDGTRYGGVLDATNGTMDDTLDYIASYNGETLPSTWISDRDVYAEGTTPTIGAEVVYTRATPITVQLAPTPVKSLEGENNISANCGQITEGKYFKRA